MIDGRIAERRRAVREQRRRHRLRRTLLLALVLGVVTGLVLVERSALVALDEIQVTGLERLEEDEVVAASELTLGTSTLRLRLGRVEERVAALPLVAEVEARRADPLTVELAVTERQPVLVARDGDTMVLVDREGVVLVEEERSDLPVIDLDDPVPAPGGTVDDHAALANAHATWRGLSGPLRVRVVRYVAPSAEGLTLELDDGVEVRFGRAERIDEKVRALGAVLEDVGDTPIEAIDVRAPRAPVVIGPEGS